MSKLQTNAETKNAAADPGLIAGVVSNIQRFSVHDGPGIRTTVFLKGCQLRCPWCHNPETWSRRPELQLFPDRCIGCRACVERCEQKAHEIIDGRHVFHRERCVGCGRCAETCYARAIDLVGEMKTARDVFEVVAADRDFYKTSGGGVTISGGEPLMQPEFTAAILQLCRREGFHTAVETNLAWPWSVVEPFLPLVDLFCVDVKLFDDAEHRRWTGVSNRMTLDNIERLDRAHKMIMVRTPVVVGVNDQPEHIRAIAEWLTRLPSVARYDLLPYHPLGTSKYASLGLTPPPESFRAPSSEHWKQLTALAHLPNRETTKE